MTQYDVISFLSDLGTEDESVGVCKAIMMQQAPDSIIIDITHQVKPFDVRAGALALTRAIQFLPTGVVLAAVDPGAPREQRYIAVELENSIFVGPDNGILAPAAQLLGEPKRVHEITNPEYRIEAPGGVFAARDIMAPAAGVIASGIDISELGNAIPLEQLVPGMLQLSRHDEGGAFLGEVWSIDRFSNVQTNITPEEMTSEGLRIGDSVIVRIGQSDFMVKFVERYADLAKSQLGMLVDSTGMLSVVKNLDFAATELGVTEGAAIAIMPQGATITGRDVTVEKIQATPPPMPPAAPVEVIPQAPMPPAAPVEAMPQAPVFNPVPVAQVPSVIQPVDSVPATVPQASAQEVGTPVPAPVIPQAPVAVAPQAIFETPQPAQSFVKEPTLMPLPADTLQEVPGAIRPVDSVPQSVPQTPVTQMAQPVQATPVQGTPVVAPVYEPSPSEVIANPSYMQFDTPVAPAQSVEPQITSGSVAPGPSIPSVAQPVNPYVQESVPQPAQTPAPMQDAQSVFDSPSYSVPQEQAPLQQEPAQVPSYPTPAPAPQAAPVDQIPSGNVFDLFKIDEDSENANGNEDPFSPAQQ